MPLGLFVGLEASSMSAVQALRNAILPKAYVKRVYPDVRAKWPCWGLPENLYVDNSAEFHSNTFKETASALGICVKFLGAGDPALRGPIERFFGILARDFIHRLPATTLGDAGRYSNYGKGAVLGLAELTHQLHKWIIDDYSQRTHRVLGDTPFKVYKAGMKHWSVQLPAVVEELDPLLGVG
jgi:putative transposase